jgi:RNA polymerase sigma-70 factor (ECF subfamily)
LSPDSKTESFVRLFSSCENELFRYVMMLLPNKSDASDVMQETAAALWEKFDEYRQGEPFFRWACSFAYYEVLKARAKHKPGRLQFSEQVVEMLAVEWPKQQGLADSRREALSRCLQRLSADHRRLVELRYGQAVTINEVARQTNRQVNTLYKTLERIRHQLMKCINAAVAGEMGR